MNVAKYCNELWQLKGELVVKLSLLEAIKFNECIKGQHRVDYDQDRKDFLLAIHYHLCQGVDEGALGMAVAETVADDWRCHDIHERATTGTMHFSSIPTLQI